MHMDGYNVMIRNEGTAFYKDDCQQQHIQNMDNWNLLPQLLAAVIAL